MFQIEGGNEEQRQRRRGYHDWWEGSGANEVCVRMDEEKRERREKVQSSKYIIKLISLVTSLSMISNLIAISFSLLVKW